MYKKQEIIYLIRNLLNEIRKDNYQNLLIYFQDIDKDGINELVSRYTINKEEYISSFKYYNNTWNNLETRQNNLYSAYINAIDGKKWGYINNEGNFIIKPQFSNAYEFQDNRAVISINKLYGVINRKGDYVVKPKYQFINHFNENKAVVVDKEGFLVIDEDGNVLTNKTYNYIGIYQDNRAIVAEDIDGNYLYGYLGDNGNIVIPIIYEEVNNFDNNKAIVKVKNSEYHLIDLDGKIINKYNYPYVGNLGDDLLAFKRFRDGKYGYINLKGEEIISPQFTVTNPFINNKAMVNISETIQNKYGLIDKHSNYKIEPKYNDIFYLGEDRYAVGKAINLEKPYLGSKYAIFNSEGTILSNFIYDDVSNFKNGLASAYNDNRTFFIDLNGKIDKELPIVKGNGTLIFIDNIIQVNVDYETYYTNRDGKIIYYPNTQIKINDEVSIYIEKYKPRKDYLVYYPQLKGMDESIQGIVNKKLMDLSKVNKLDNNLDYSYYGNFTIIFYKDNLLEIELDGYKYPYGAAHGMPYKEFVHLDLVSGNFYNLNELFNENSDYVNLITNIIKNEVKENKAYNHIFPDSDLTIKENQLFYVTENDLHILYKPYEIAPYVAGYPEFIIPFSDIMSIININGQFWKSFHK